MKYSFIGLGKPVAAVNNLLKNHIKNYRISHVGEEMPLEPGGVFSSNISAAASFAGENDMCVYPSLEELLINSDIIFIFLSDKAIKSISLTLGKHDIKNKIFCHVSPAYNADILDFNSKNSYMSWHFPYYIKDENDRTIPECIIAEGYGKRIEIFKEIMQLLSIKISFVSAEEKLMCQTAELVAKDLPLMLQYTSKRLIKYALASLGELSDDLMEMAEKSPESFNSYNPIQKDDADFVARQLDVLENLGIDEITKLYASLISVAAHTSIEQTKESERIKMLAKKHIK